MSKEGAKKFHDALKTDVALREKVKAHLRSIEKVGADHGYDFDHIELYDVIHEESGMTKVGNSTEREHPDTCVPFLSETPKY